jgi:hypothetical protein
VTIDQDIPGWAYALDAGRLVWAAPQPDGLGTTIYLKLLTSGEVSEIASVPDGLVLSVDISGGLVAWWVTDMTGATIWWRWLNRTDPPTAGVHVPRGSATR